MIEKTLLYLVSIALLCLGAYIYLRPISVARKIQLFYSKEPIIRYAGEKQLTSRPVFVRLLGIVIGIIGIICFFSI